MIGWVDDLPVGRMIVVIFALGFARTAAIYFGVIALAVGERGERADPGGREPGAAGDGTPARDAHRRPRPGATVNWVKWTSILALAALTLVAIAFVHSGSRRTAAIALGLFAGAAAVAVVMIATQDRPFGGRFGVKPDVLLQVVPPAR